MRISLSNKLALFFAAVTFFAIGVLYLYVAPGLQKRLVDEKLKELARSALRHSGPIARTVGASDSLAVIRSRVNNAAAGSGARVTLLSVSVAVAPGGPQLGVLADSSNPSAT